MVSDPLSLPPDARASRASSISSASIPLPTVTIKKYSCMYTADVQKNKKVWHDGYVKLHHINSKAYLYSDCSERLAESFVKIAARRSRTADQTAARASCQLPEQFELMQDEELEFDDLEDSHQLRAGRFLAQIIALVDVEHKVLQIATPSDSYSHQENQKRKMDFLDEQIKRFDKPKRPRGPSSSSSNNEQVSPFKTTTTTPSKSSKDVQHTSTTKPISSIRRSNIQSKAFQSPLLAQPFQSPLLNRTAGASRTGPQYTSQMMSPPGVSHQLNQLPDSPASDSPPDGDRVGKLKTLNLNWKPFCDASG